jgi:hypothetical protein
MNLATSIVLDSRAHDLQRAGRPVRTILYGIVRNGLVFSARTDRFGATGTLTWGKLLSAREWRRLRFGMLNALVQMELQARAPSKNQTRRMRQRLQAP